MQSFRHVCLVGAVLFLTLMMNAAEVQGQSRTRPLAAQGNVVAVCHATGSRENPYVLIKVSDNGEAHRRHPADIVPALVDGCPGPGAEEPTEPVPEPLTMLLFGAGVAGAGYAARRFKKKS